MTLSRVILWGKRIGSVEWDDRREVGVFQYAADFAGSGIEPSPITMPLSSVPYSFPELPGAFHGLPGLLSDSLPDRFGHRLIDAWLARQGRLPGSMNPVERLCYIGRRGMGALEFEPSAGRRGAGARPVDIAALVALANEVLDERAGLSGRIGADYDEEDMQEMLRVGTSAGGARAKALLAWNRKSGEFRSGQLDGLEGFEHWLLKFDGVSNNRDKELADPLGYGRIEYAYHLMAAEAGIEMTECRLHHEGGRSHFMTRRFDRTAQGRKRHMQSLAALCHFDYNDPSAYSYEQAMQTIRRISQRPQQDVEQQFSRATFNLMARNQDDHVKNIAFLMDPDGRWHLSPAFDVTYAYNPDGQFTGRQQMSVNGKRGEFRFEDLIALAKSAGVKPGRAKARIEQVAESLQRWPEFAEAAGVSEAVSVRIARAHRPQIGRAHG